MKKHSAATRALHADRPLERNLNIAPPVFPSVTNVALDETDFARKSGEPFDPDFYTRHGNVNASRIAQVIAALEGAEQGLMFGSGMGAMANAVLALVGQGDHVIAQQSHYIGSTKLMQEVLPRFGVSVTQVKQTDIEAFRSSIQPNTRLIVVETPVNPTMELTDLEAVANLARERGIITLCDNTFASPILQQPIAWGIDLVMHSVTKYIGGHHDLLAGCVVGPTAVMGKIWNMNTILGSMSAPFNSWLALRGIRTLEMRMQKHCANAMAIAEFLRQHPKVGQVFYPGLSAHPQRALVEKQMQGQGGGVLSFELAAGYEAGVQFISSLEIFQNAASLGGVDSLVIQPAVMWGGRLSEEVIAEQGISPGMIRMAVGIEDAGDLVADLEQALAKI
jgi:cystathionine beta-lyase/cystathionine gamma-synthase